MEEHLGSRFPNFINVIIAILEAKIEPIIGKNAVSELKSPFEKKELEKKLYNALLRAEARFLIDFPQKEISDALRELPIADLPTMKSALLLMYQSPTDPNVISQFENQLRNILPSSFDEEKIIRAAKSYFQYTLEELSAIPEIVNKLQALAIIRTEFNTSQMLKLLQSIDENLSITNKLISDKSLRVNLGKYEKVASVDAPALVIFLIDIGPHMSRKVDGIPAIELIKENIQYSLTTMARRSLRQGIIHPRYHVGCFCYADEIIDIYDGIQGISKIIENGLTDFTPRKSQSDSYKALLYIEKLLNNLISRYLSCPPPLVCHITAGEYPGRDPEPVASRIKSLRVEDGNILMENILIDSQTILIPPKEAVEKWSGVSSETQLARAYARQLYRMSSFIPETYRSTVNQMGEYNIGENSKLLFPGLQSKMISLGFAMSAVTGAPIRHSSPQWEDDV